jgi:hypothetical protein
MWSEIHHREHDFDGFGAGVEVKIEVIGVPPVKVRGSLPVGIIPMAFFWYLFVLEQMS